MTGNLDLFAPYRFRCGVVAQNRMTLAPLTNCQSHDDGALSEEEFRWLTRRAVGGYSIVMTCASHVSSDGKGFDGQLGCFSDAHLTGLRRLATAIKNQGALALLQLYHGGARAPSRLTGQQPFSASAWEETTPGRESPRAATEAEILRVIDDFAAAARRARAAGFDGVEIHGAHNYLLSQFLSQLNERTDDWGGSLERRARLIRNVTQRIRAENPAPFIVGVRLSPENLGFMRGLDLDESIKIAYWLAAEDNVDFIDLSLWDCALHTQKRPEEHPLPLFRKAIPLDVAIFAAGNLHTRADADHALQRGADFVSLGRVAMLEPDWPKRIAQPQFTPLRPPLTAKHWRELELSDRFIVYLRNTFRALVAD